ncbi:hypothetical protein KQH27_00260 [bacterium]|nr:hypothetical protein [bacterium]
MHKPRRPKIWTGGHTKRGQAKAIIGQSAAMVVTRNIVLGRYIANVLSLSVNTVQFSNSGIDALKEINSSINFTILITDLLIDEVSGIALGIVLKKKRPAFLFGINNGSEACKIVAIENGFNMVYDAANTPEVIYQYFPLGNTFHNNNMELKPSPNFS